MADKPIADGFYCKQKSSNNSRFDIFNLSMDIWLELGQQE